MNALISMAWPAALLSVSLFLTGCGDQPKKHSPRESSLPAAPVSVQLAEEKRVSATEELPGTVRAKHRATVEAKVSGRIRTLAVVEGQSVEAGQRLIELDVEEFRAQTTQAQAQQDLAERDLDRLSALVAQGAVTQQEYDAAQARHQVTRATLDEAKSMLAYAEITAPFTGVITRKLTDVGDLAFPGKPLLELEDPNTLRLEANLPEAMMGTIRLGSVLPVHLPALDLRLEGTVTELAPTTDSATRTLGVKLDLPQHPGLRGGMFGRIAVPLPERTILRVPASAVVRRGQMEMVFVAAEDHAHMRLVKTGQHSDQEIELLSGLKPGELVVVDGAANLQDGQPLQIRP